MTLSHVQHTRRLRNWRQTADTRIHAAEEAIPLIDQVGIATLYPVSAEFPDLYHAFVGDPERKPEATWDSPAGQVYCWRWELGRKSAAFYSTLVRRRPTWVSWAILPAVLRLRMERREPEELYQAGELSEPARRVAKALDACPEPVRTDELRAAAGFPKGKEHRAAYLKAVEELESRLLLAKTFAPDPNDESMCHALVSVQCADHVAAAQRLTEAEAVDSILTAYLPNAVYAYPKRLAKDLSLPQSLLIAALDRLCESDRAARADSPDAKEPVYLICDD